MTAKRVQVLGAGVVGQVYAGRMLAAGYDVSVVARGQRRDDLLRHGLRLRTGGATTTGHPRVTDRVGDDGPVDLTVVSVRQQQLGEALELLAGTGSEPCAFFQHVGSTRSAVAELGDRAVVAFPGFGGERLADGTVEYVEVGSAQPTTIDATATHASTLRDLLAPTRLRCTLERQMDAWLTTRTVFVASLGAGILRCGGDATALARDATVLREVVAAVRDGFEALERDGVRVTPGALRALFATMPGWFAAAYWRRALRGPLGTVALAPHTRASRDDEFRLVCAEALARAGGSPDSRLAQLVTPYV